MSTKPATVPTWATDVSAALLTPTAGKRARGFVPGKRPAAQYFNWLANAAGAWFQYLSDGALSGDHTLAGNLTLAAGWNVTVQGSGDYKFGTRRRIYSCPGYFSTASWNTAGSYAVSAGAGTVVWPIMMCAGWRATSLSIDVYGQGGGAFGLNFVKEDNAGGVVTQTDTHTPTNSVWTTRTFNITGTICTLSDAITIFATMGATGMLCRRLVITEDYP
jgi:hypothetical protein